MLKVIISEYCKGPDGLIYNELLNQEVSSVHEAVNLVENFPGIHELGVFHVSMEGSND